MISTPDRVKAVELIDQAVVDGARRAKACEELARSLASVITRIDVGPVMSV